MVIDVIYILASVLATTFYISSVQFKEKKDILKVQVLASICYATTYFILGATTGFVTEILEQIKSIIFYFYEKNNKKIPFLLLILFLTLVFITAILAYNGFNTLVPLIVNILLFTSTYFKNPKYIRYTVLLCSFIWMYYNYSIGAYIVIIGNIFEAVSSLISIIRFRKKKA